MTTSINSLYHTARETDRQTQRERLITFLSFHSVCPAGKDYVADRLSSTCYRLDLSVKNWTTARDDCAANGEMLVVLEPVVKAQFIKDLMTANRRMFCDGEKTKNNNNNKRLYNIFNSLHTPICGVTVFVGALKEVQFLCLSLFLSVVYSVSSVMMLKKSPPCYGHIVIT